MALNVPSYSNILIFLAQPVDGSGYQQNIPIIDIPKKATTVPVLQFGKPIYQVSS